MKTLLMLILVSNLLYTAEQATTADADAKQCAIQQLVRYLIKINDYQRLFTLKKQAFELRKPFIQKIALETNNQELLEKIKLHEECLAQQLSKPTPTVEHIEHLTEELYSAARNGNVEKLKCLLAERVYPNTTLKNELTPLLIAAMNGHTECIHHLITAGANIEQAEKIAKKYQFAGAVIVLEKIKNELGTPITKTKNRCVLL